jgi:GDP-D-mannose 3',5'-epimerase
VYQESNQPSDRSDQSMSERLREFALPRGEGRRVCVGGGAGFIGSHIAKRLKEAGWYVVVVDIKENEFMPVNDYCNEFIRGDLRKLEVACAACQGCTQVYNAAAVMGGMGFIIENQPSLAFSNTAIDLNLLEAARRNNVKHFFYSSSAGVYRANQERNDQDAWVEGDAWPAQLVENGSGSAPTVDMYAFEKLYAEQMALAYGRDFDMKIRIARFHNIYGPPTIWDGGREKAVAAFCRQAIEETDPFEIWGDGKQRRSFTYIDDCVEGVMRLMFSDCEVPVNLGTAQTITLDELANLVSSFEGRRVNIQHRLEEGNIGVGWRTSNNQLILEQLGWEPTIPIAVGLRTTYFWIREQIIHRRNQEMMEEEED